METMGYLRRSVRSSLANPAKWLLYGLGASNQAYAGINVTESTALSYTAVLAAVRFISETIANLPLHLYRRQERGKTRAINHPLYNLLHLRPNSEMASMEFRQMLISQCVCNGTAYAEKEMTQAGNLIALWPLISTKMQVKQRTDTTPLHYIYTAPGGQQGG